MTQSGPAAASTASTLAASVPMGPARKTTSAPSRASVRSSAQPSMAPSSRALESTEGSGSYPHTSAPARPRAARQIEPPMRPRPRTATLKRPGPRPEPSEGGAQCLAGELGGALEGEGELGEGVRQERLWPVADGLVGIWVHLDDDAVRS